MEPEGKWKLSPAYDICHAYRPESTWVSQHNLSINGKRNGFVKDDLLTIAKQNSIRDPEGIMNEVLGVVTLWRDYATSCKVEETLAKAIDATLIKQL